MGKRRTDECGEERNLKIRRKGEREKPRTGKHWEEEGGTEKYGGERIREMWGSKEI